MPSGHHRRGGRHHHKEVDPDSVLSRNDQRNDPYMRERDRDRRQYSSSSGYRRQDSLSHSGKASYDSRSLSSRGQHDTNWRAKDYEDEYYRERRDAYDIPSAREPESWGAPSHEPRYVERERDWAPYESIYPTPVYEHASWPPPNNAAQDHRNGHQERWDRGHQNGRHSDRVPVVDERRDWSNRHSRASYPDQWASTSPRKSIPADRAWEPAPGWQAAAASNERQRTQRQQSEDYYDVNPSRHAKNPAPNRRSGSSSNSNYHRYTNNKPQRDWRDEESTLNNWSRRAGYETERAPLPSPSSRKHRRSPSPTRSRSHSPTDSLYSRRSSGARTRSPSASPASKRRRRTSASYERDQTEWVPRQTDAPVPPRLGSPTPSRGSRRSTSRSPRSPHNGHHATEVVDLNAAQYELQNGFQTTTLSQAEQNDSESMPPPSIIPSPHISQPQPLPEFPRTTFTQSIPHARRGTGFKPLGRSSNSLRKFFPGDDDDMELSSDPPATTEAAMQLPPAQDEQPPDPPSPHSRASSVVMEDEVAPDPPTMQPSPPRPVEPESSAQTRNSTPSAQRPSELYDIKGHVGEGTFGKVYKAENLVTGGFVALKRIRMESEKEGFPVTAMREIKLLQSLRHENVVRLFEMMVSNGSVSMVFEYMEHDLTGILSQTQFAFTEAHLKSLCRQMLAGLAYLHHKGVIHRDIKGSNILVNNRGQLKLADFGLARFYQKRRRTDYTNRVITQWYRPPELLLGATVYGPEVDMWSAGCIMLELFTKKPVFQGNDEIHQLDTIYKIIGTPTVDRWPDMVNLPWYELVKPREDIPNRFRDMFKKWMSVPALDLAEQLLCYDPETRITATQALETPYFTQEAPAAEAPTGLATLSAEWHELDTKRAKKKKKD